MRNLILLAILPSLSSAFPASTNTTLKSDHSKYRLPYSVSCTDDPEEILLTTTADFFAGLVAPAVYPLLISLKRSPTLLCGHNDFLLMQAVKSANATNHKILAKSVFFDTDDALAAYFDGLIGSKMGEKKSQAKRQVAQIAQTAGKTIAKDLVADAVDPECPPCEVVTTAKTLYDVGGLIASVVGCWFECGSDSPPASPPPPPSPQPPEPAPPCMQMDPIPVDLEPCDPPENALCSVSCNNCEATINAQSQVLANGSYTDWSISGLQYTGTVVPNCSAATAKQAYKLCLVNSKNPLGEVTVQTCDMPDATWDHEIDINVVLSGEVEVANSGHLQFDFVIVTHGLDYETSPPQSAEAQSFAHDFEGTLEGEYSFSANLEGGIRDVTTLNGELFAGYGINAEVALEIVGTGPEHGASSTGSDVTETSTAVNSSDSNASGESAEGQCKRSIEGESKIWASVYASGGDVLDVSLWNSTTTIVEGEATCL